MELTLKFNLEQVNIILASLGKQSYETVAPLIDSIRGQAQPQLQAAEQVQDVQTAE
jgi:hypothetical protein